MRIAISNLAWDVPDEEEVASLLNSFGIDAIDIAPGKYFTNPSTVNDLETERVRHWWADRGIEITGMQALLFGTTGLNMFGDNGTQNLMLAHLADICRIGGKLGATRLVFGSPKNRDRSHLSDEKTQSEAVTFFCRLGDIAIRHGVVICLEPNPPRYGANFMTNSAETAKTVINVSHPAIRMQLDTGTTTINGEDPGEVINKYGALIGHVHASEPDLVVLGDGETDHGNVASVLRARLPDQIVSVEMLPAKNESRLAAIERALRVAVLNYQG